MKRSWRRRKVDIASGPWCPGAIGQRTQPRRAMAGPRR